MDEEKKPQFLKPMIIAACVLAVFALFYFGMQYFTDNQPVEIPSTVTPSPTAAPEQTSEPDATEEPMQIPEPQKELTLPEAMDICQAAAIKHLGEGTMILPDFEGALIEVTYDGKTRPCYVFIGGGVDYFLQSSSLEPPARYAVDVATGEVFDTISKKYIR